RIATTGIIGLCLLSLLIFLVGAVMLNAVSMIVLLFAVAALTFRDLIAWIGDLIGWLRGGVASLAQSERWPRFLASVALFMIALAFVWTLMPPSKWDVLTYHLAGPEQYVEHGSFYAAKHNHFLGFPQLVDTLYAGQLAITGRLAGSSLIHWVIGVYLLMMAGGYTARRANQAAGWLAVTILLAATTIWQEMTFAYNDLLPIALAVIGLAVIEAWDAVRYTARRDADSANPTDSHWRRGIGYVLLLGMIAGFGMSTKYTVIWLAAAFGLLIVWQMRRDGLRNLIMGGAVYGLTALITFAPWLIRNTIWYDSPTYPMLFEAAEMDTLRQEWYSQPESGLIYGENAWQIPLLPVMATFIGVEGAGMYNTDIGPLFLILLPLLLLTWRQLTADERITLKHAWIVAGIMFAAWLISASLGSYISVQTRLVLYMFGPLAVAGGITFESLRQLPKKPVDLGFVMQALVAMTMVFMAINSVQLMNTSGVQLYFSGEKDYEQQYLEHTLGWHIITMQDLNDLPEGSTVRFLWEPRYLYCDNEYVNCITDSLMDAWYYARNTVESDNGTVGNPTAIADLWQQDADYLLVYDYGRRFECGRDLCGSGEAGNDLYTEADWRAWDTFVSEHLTEVWHNTAPDDGVIYILYEWQNPSGRQ
ncbi:MAG: hypothetical protein JXA10_18490, partial [Anaerolineae bacterium]|nr:hypothetical protein [Anaerolineae bacterium]